MDAVTPIRDDLAFLAATHMAPWLAVLLSGVLVAAMAWYWPRLGRGDIPAERRRVRRISLMFSLAGLVAATLGFGIIDPDARRVPYALAWLGAGAAILVVILLAIVDAFLSMRLHRKAIRTMRREREVTLGKAIAEARLRGEARPSPPPPGDGASP